MIYNSNETYTILRATLSIGSNFFFIRETFWMNLLMRSSIWKEIKFMITNSLPIDSSKNYIIKKTIIITVQYSINLTSEIRDKNGYCNQYNIQFQFANCLIVQWESIVVSWNIVSKPIRWSAKFWYTGVCVMLFPNGSWVIFNHQTEPQHD